MVDLDHIAQALIGWWRAREFEQAFLEGEHALGGELLQRQSLARRGGDDLSSDGVLPEVADDVADDRPLGGRLGSRCGR
ncbi:hypothetical protein [Nonomuraea jabiensis]|uniref:hypothetical protein n=1 Tax=Nonomuraea jabiensis TaxID=882448 RepID=UPI003D73176B